MFEKHLESLNEVKKGMAARFGDHIYQVYFTEELLKMDVDLLVLNYLDPSMLILGPMIDFGTPPPGKLDYLLTKIRSKTFAFKLAQNYIFFRRQPTRKCPKRKPRKS